MIELTVVIAMLGILVMILFPVFVMAREKTNQSSCQSNLKAIGLASLMYAEDHDKTLPLSISGKMTWRAVLVPWFENDNPAFLTCPSARNLDYRITSGKKEIEVRGGYGINEVHGEPGPPTPPPGIHLPEIARPNEAIWVTDHSQWSVKWYSNKGFDRPSDLPPYPLKPKPSQRHILSANYLYCDGHVKQRKPIDVSCSTPHSYENAECPWDTGVKYPLPQANEAEENLQALIERLQVELDTLKAKLDAPAEK